MTRAFVFPGQGSQAVGMGKAIAEAFPSAREVFEEVDDALGERLSQLMFEGPLDDLTLTRNAQPALMAVSLAVSRVLEREANISIGRAVSFVAGHSLGEYSALTAAGALTLGDSARLLRARGDAMQQAVPVGEGAMAALLGLDLDVAEEVSRAAVEAGATAEVCVPANDNAPGQVVISGHRDAVARAVDLAKEKGARRAMMLSVSAPFHCELMAPAADEMARRLGTVEIMAPAVPLVANVTASAVSDPERIRELLVEQVTAMVRWRESVAYMHDRGVTEFCELGTGKVLTGLIKRIAPDASGMAVQEPQDIEALAKAF